MQAILEHIMVWALYCHWKCKYIKGNRQIHDDHELSICSPYNPDKSIFLLIQNGDLKIVKDGKVFEINISDPDSIDKIKQLIWNNMPCGHTGLDRKVWYCEKCVLINPLNGMAASII